MSTEVDATWDWKLFSGLEEVKQAVPLFDKAFDAARGITMKVFAEDNSASVQATMYKMSELILAAEPKVEHVTYALPNKHYFEIGKSSNLTHQPRGFG